VLRLQLICGAIRDYEIVVRWLLRNSIVQPRFSRIGLKFISVCLCRTRPCVIRINHFRYPLCPRSSPSPPCTSRRSSSCSSRCWCPLPHRRSSPCSLLRAAARARAPSIAARPRLPCTRDSVTTANRRIRARQEATATNGRRSRGPW
jgi:hypothetical protein